MNKLISIFIVSLSFTIATSDIYSNSWALVIGIDKYQNVQPLNYAVNDAKTIKDILVNTFNFGCHFKFWGSRFCGSFLLVSRFWGSFLWDTHILDPDFVDLDLGVPLEFRRGSKKSPDYLIGGLGGSQNREIQNQSK